MKKIFFLILAIVQLNSAICQNKGEHEIDLESKNFGGWSLSKELYDYILQILPKGKTLLELGSGWGSSQLSKHYTVYSIEHNSKWIGKYNTNYIFAPIENSWYSVSALQKQLPANYDLILIDGPTGKIGRSGFFTNLSLFKTNVPMIFDDVNRSGEFTLMENVAKALKREYTIFSTSDHKKFGVILPS